MSDIFNAWSIANLFSLRVQKSSHCLNKKAVLSQRWPRGARYISRSWAVAEMWPFEIIQRCRQPPSWIYSNQIAPLDQPPPKTPPYNQTWSGSDDRLRRYGHLKFFQHDGGRHLGFVRIVNSAVRSAVPENPTLEPNIKWITRCRDMAIRVWRGHMESPFGGNVGRTGSAMAPLERAMVVSCRLSIVTVTLGYL